MKTRLWRTVLIGVAVLTPSVAFAAPDVERRLAQLQSIRPGDGGAVLAECIRDLDALPLCSTRDVRARLLNLLANAESPLEVRWEVLRLLIRHADPELARELVGCARSWMTPSGPGAAGPAGSARRRGGGGFMAREVMHQLAGEPWRSWIGGERASLEFLASSDTHEWLTALAASPAPPEDIREVAVGVVGRGSRGTTQLPRPLIEMLDMAAAPALRRMVLDSESDGGGFHFAALSALADLGDAEFLPELRRMAAMARERGEPPLGYTLPGPVFALALEPYIWRIEVQQESSRLLAFIASDAIGPIDDHQRVWAIWTAARRGLSRPAIREAILRHADAVHRLARSTGDAAVLRRPVHMQLCGVKAEGVQQGVLDEHDLPEVDVRPSLLIGCP